jgi:1-deoxy-D-xylulose-5-phosphate synthase
MKPFCNIYSSFSMRALDQIFHDVALQGLPVVLCLDRSGIVGEDGATHHGCYDMAIYRTLPGAVIAAPKDEIELKDMMYSAYKATSGPYIIRYPRGYGEGVDWKGHEFSIMETGKGEMMMEGSEIAIIAAGPVVNRAAEAADKMKSETGWNPAIYNIRYIKPLDTDLLSGIPGSFRKVITIEDGCIMGGLHGAVSEFLSGCSSPVPVRAIGIEDRYISQGTQEELREECGLTTDFIYALLKEEKEKIDKKD